MKYISAMVLALLIEGCTTLEPYVFGGLGYATATNKAPFDETGMTGTYGIGLEFTPNFACEYRHRSMVTNRPEIVTDDAGCEYTHYFRGR